MRTGEVGVLHMSPCALVLVGTGGEVGVAGTRPLHSAGLGGRGKTALSGCRQLETESLAAQRGGPEALSSLLRLFPVAPR